MLFRSGRQHFTYVGKEGVFALSATFVIEGLNADQIAYGTWRWATITGPSGQRVEAKQEPRQPFYFPPVAGDAKPTVLEYTRGLEFGRELAALSMTECTLEGEHAVKSI